MDDYEVRRIIEGPHSVPEIRYPHHIERATGREVTIEESFRIREQRRNKPLK
jgi:hypothetical protein